MSLADALTAPPMRKRRLGVIDKLLRDLPDTEAAALRAMLADPFRWPAHAVVTAITEHCQVQTSTTAVRVWRQQNP